MGFLSKLLLALAILFTLGTLITLIGVFKEGAFHPIILGQLVVVALLWWGPSGLIAGKRNGPCVKRCRGKGTPRF